MSLGYALGKAAGLGARWIAANPKAVGYAAGGIAGSLLGEKQIGKKGGALGTAALGVATGAAYALTGGGFLVGTLGGLTLERALSHIVESDSPEAKEYQKALERGVKKIAKELPRHIRRKIEDAIS